MSSPPSNEPAPLPAGTKPQWSPAGDYYWDGTKWVLYFKDLRLARTDNPPIAPPPPSYPQPAYQASPWAPAKTQVTVSAGTAFKIGFFGIMGAWVASLIPAVIIWVLTAIVFASCVASLGRSGG